MSKVDDELTRRLHRAERPVDVDALFEGLGCRRSHRERVHRVQAALLAFAVLAATAGSFLALSRVFRADRAARPGGSEGRIVFGRAQLAQLEQLPGSASSGHGFEIWSMAADGSDLRPVVTDRESATTPVWSPDGSRIAFLDKDSRALGLGTLRLLSSEADGSDVTVIAEGLAEPLVRALAWSPDGTRIAVLDTKEHDLDSLDEFGLPLAEIAVYALNGSRQALVDIPGTAGGFAWSPDGQGFTVARYDQIDEQGGVDLVQVDLQGVVLGLLAKNVALYPPAWSPDGSRIAFVRQEPLTSGSDIRGDDFDVWTVNADGTDEERLTGDGGRKPSLAWTPDGTRILYSTQTPDRCYIVSIRPDGSGRTVVADRSMMGGCAQEVSVRPGVTSTTPRPSPDTNSTADDGRDIGLGFNVCNLERLGGVDWFGDGIEGAAWTGTRVDDRGRCGHESIDSVLAADLDGDGSADTWKGIDECTQCEPWAATDLDGNGTEELVVMLFADLQPTFAFYFAVPDGLPRASGIYHIFLEGPGSSEVGLRSEGIVTVQAGAGEEGISANAIRCEGYPDDPVLVVAKWIKDEGTGAVEYHGARLKLEASEDLVDAHFVIVDTFTPTASSEDFGGDGKACGVDFNPWN
jgi:WD40 repeat protein